MAVGDIKNPGAIVKRYIAGATVAIGDVVHLEPDDGKWDPVTNGDLGSYGVAVTGGADTEEISVCIWGEIEVTATSAAIANGELVIPASTGLIRKYAVATDASGNTVIGKAMEAFGSGDTASIFLGVK